MRMFKLTISGKIIHHRNFSSVSLHIRKQLMLMFSVMKCSGGGVGGGGEMERRDVCGFGVKCHFKERMKWSLSHAVEGFEFEFEFGKWRWGTRMSNYR